MTLIKKGFIHPAILLITQLIIEILVAIITETGLIIPHLVTTKTYSVETNVYLIKEDKIIYPGLTKTSNPDGVHKMTEEVAQLVYRRILSEGFVKDL